jgi:hypothetical protein
MSGERANRVPGDNGKNNSENQKDKERQAPKFFLPSFELLET